MNFVFANAKVPFWFRLCVWGSKVQGGECWRGLCEVSRASRVGGGQAAGVLTPSEERKMLQPSSCRYWDGKIGGGGVRLCLRLEATGAQIQPRNEELSKVCSRCNLWCLSNMWHGVQNKASPRSRVWRGWSRPGGTHASPHGVGRPGRRCRRWMNLRLRAPSTLSSHPTCPRWSPVGSVPFPVNPN